LLFVFDIEGFFANQILEQVALIQLVVLAQVVSWIPDMDLVFLERYWFSHGSLLLNHGYYLWIKCWRFYLPSGLNRRKEQTKLAIPSAFYWRPNNLYWHLFVVAEQQLPPAVAQLSFVWVVWIQLKLLSDPSMTKIIYTSFMLYW